MAMDIPVFRILDPGQNRVQNREIALASNFDFADATAAFKRGFWVKDVAGVATHPGGSAGDGTDTVATHPVLTASGRMDVRQSKKITVATGIFRFETTAYKTSGSYAVGDELTIEADANGRGILDEAVSTQIIFAKVVKPPQAGVNGLIAETVGMVGNVKA